MLSLGAMYDAAIVRRVLAGEREEFGLLVRKHLAYVLAIARGQLGLGCDAEDVAQETFTTAYRALDQLRAPERFQQWLATIARNQCHQHRASHARAERELQEFARDTAQSVSFDPAQQERHALLRRALDELPTEHREVLFIFYFSSGGIRGIEAAMDLSREAAKKRLQRARVALSRQLEHDLSDLAHTYRPGQKQTTRITALALASAPLWAPIAHAGTATWVMKHALGGNAMGLKVAGIAGLLFAGLAAIQFSGAAPNEITAVKPVTQSVQRPLAPLPSVHLVSASALAEPAPVPQHEAAPVPSEQQPGEVTISSRTSTAGGNPQRTGFYQVPAPLSLPQVRWEATLGGENDQPGTAPVVGLAGTVYISHSDERGAALSAFTLDGDLLWRLSGLNDSRMLSSPTVLPDGILIQNHGGLTGFDAKTGTVLWQVETGVGQNASSIADSGGSVYMTGSLTKTGVVKLAAKNGKPLWPVESSPRPLAKYSSVSPCISRDGHTVYGGSRYKRGGSEAESVSITTDGTVVQKKGLAEGPDGLTALNASDGSLRWSFVPGGAERFMINWSSPVVGAGGVVYQQDAHTGLLYALKDSGDHASVLWTYDPKVAGTVQRFEKREGSTMVAGAGIWSHDAPRLLATDGEAVYIGVFGYPASVHAINVDGTAKWATRLEGDVIIGSPSVTGRAVYVVAGGDDQVAGQNALYCLDKSDGKTLWSMPIAAPKGDVGEGLAFAPDGTIYLATSGLQGKATLMAVR